MQKDSNEILKQAVAETGVKQVSTNMGLSASLIYKWCEAKDDEGESGVQNPLDRILAIISITGSYEPLAWLCEKAGGFFVRNIIPTRDINSGVMRSTQAMLKEFSELLREVSKSAEDGNICEEESTQIRKEWEDLKSVTEAFVVACEAGKFNKTHVKDIDFE